ncbi:MAG: hypothetical protein IJT94_06315, partial [Oscillibacter sp.]|nr:hypothetical protein [Oscillibacter sp.]
NSTKTVYSQRQLVFEALYGAPFDLRLWNDAPAKSYHHNNPQEYNACTWTQVNGGTYAAQLPLTIFNASDPEGANRAEFGYFGEDQRDGAIEVYVEKTDAEDGFTPRRASESSGALTRDSFQKLSMHCMVASSSPAPIFSYQKQENTYADGYEFWGYSQSKTSPKKSNGVNFLNSADILGWKGTSLDKTQDLAKRMITIGGKDTHAYWISVKKDDSNSDINQRTEAEKFSGVTYKLSNSDQAQARIYLMRKTYRIGYANALDVAPSAYLYREPVTRLPGLSALTAANCPYGNNYAFKGWYTSSSFAEETRVTDEYGEFTNAFRANSGLFEADEGGVYASAFRMPSYNLVLVARWEKAANTVTFHPCFPASGSSPAWTMTNLAADGTVPDEEFYLVADEQDRASHQALMSRLVDQYGGDRLEYRDDAWYYVSGDAEWKFDGWYYYHGAEGTIPDREDLTQQYNLTAPVVSDDHLYARWTQTKGRLTITVVCRDRDTKLPITGTGGTPYTQTFPDLNINMATPEVITLFARTDIPGYFPVLASRDITVTAENETVCMDYEKGVNWSYTIQPSVLLDDGTTSSLFASTNGISDSWEAQIPAPQYAGYVIQENEYFKAADYFYHKVDLTRSSGSGEGTGGSEEGTVWQRMNGTTKTLTALYVPDATAFTIPTDPIVLNTEGGTVPAGWLNTTPLLTGRFYTEKPDADGTLPWIGDTYRFQAVYSLWRTDEKGRPVLDGNKNQIQDKVTVSYGRSARDILEVRDGDGNALSGFGFLDTLEEGRTYEIHVDAAFVDESGNPVLSMLQDGVPAPLAANAARQGLTLPPCTFTVQAVSLPGE